MRYFLVLMALFFPVAGPVQGQVTGPFHLSSGMTVTFERPGIYKFPKTNDTLLMLVFLTDSALLDDLENIDKDDDRMKADAMEICQKYADDLIKYHMKAFANVLFTVMAIKIRKQVGEEGGLRKYNNWTSVFHLENGECGEQIEK